MKKITTIPENTHPVFPEPITLVKCDYSLRDGLAVIPPGWYVFYGRAPGRFLSWGKDWPNALRVLASDLYFFEHGYPEELSDHHE